MLSIVHTMAVCCELQKSSRQARFSYNREFLLQNRGQGCRGISRILRRNLFYLKILSRHDCQVSYPIPVRLSKGPRRKRSGSCSRNAPAILRRIAPLMTHKTRKPAPVLLPSVFLTNARSMRNKMDELALRIMKRKPGLIVISETWLDNSIDSSFLQLPNYTACRQDRDSHGGGLMVYFRAPYTYTQCPCLSFHVPNCKTEFLVFYMQPGNILVVVLYHPYWGKTPFHSIVSDNLIDIVSHGRTAHEVNGVIICGDFNGLADEVCSLNSILGTVSLFEFPTRDNAQLDFLLTNSPKSFQQSICLPPLGKSDHVVIFCQSKKSIPPPQVRKVKFRSKTPAACANFRYDLLNNDFFERILMVDDVNQIMNMFLDFINPLLDEHFPFKTVRLRSDDKAWVKPSLKLLINRRDRAFAERKSLKYQRLRQAVIDHVKELKSDYLTSATRCKDPHKLWRYVNNLASLKKPHVMNVKTDDLARLFSSAFESSDMSNVCIPECSNDLSIYQQEVIDTIRSLKKSSPGPDGLPVWVLKDHCDMFAPVLHHLFSLSIASGEVPAILKLAHVTPIPKCDNPSASDYRPISITSVISKVLEKIIHKKWLCNISSTISCNQFAFLSRVGQGSVNALTYIMHRIFSFLDSPGAVRVLMIDFEKAFDKVPHDIILNALIAHHAPFQIVRWVKSYLHMRKQRVKVNEEFSQWYLSQSGVPQGGVLSPLLFALVVDSLQACSSNSHLVKFADDMCLLHFVRHGVDDRLSQELEHISGWSKEHGLKINLQKTKLLDIITKRSLTLQPLIDKNSNCLIENVCSAKILGLMIDTNLSWQPQVDFVLRKLRKRIYVLHALRQANASDALLWSVYCQLMRSVASYAYPAWCNVTKGRLLSIVSFENKMSRFFKFSCKTSFSDFCDLMAGRLARKAHDPSHPLNCIFDKNATRYSSRLSKTHRKLLAKTVRFKNSFIFYA